MSKEIVNEYPSYNEIKKLLQKTKLPNEIINLINSYVGPSETAKLINNLIKKYKIDNEKRKLYKLYFKKSKNTKNRNYFKITIKKFKYMVKQFKIKLYKYVILPKEKKLKFSILVDYAYLKENKKIKRKAMIYINNDLVGFVESEYHLNMYIDYINDLF
jgi:hypothetical protein